MKANTRLFGEIDIAEDRIITLEHGMIGLPDFTKFALIYDEEKPEKERNIMWLQSMDDGETAFPVVVPAHIKEDYSPNVNADIIAPIGELHPDNTYILVTVTVPRDITKFSVNLKAPIIINTDTNLGVQVIVEDNYPVKYPAYDIIKARKEKAGE